MKRLLTALSILLVPLTVHAVPIQTYEFTLETLNPALRVSGEVTAEDNADGFIDTGEVQGIQLSLGQTHSDFVLSATDIREFHLNTTTNTFMRPPGSVGIPVSLDLVAQDDSAFGLFVISDLGLSNGTPTQTVGALLFDSATRGLVFEVDSVEITDVRLTLQGPTPVQEPTPIALLSAGLIAFGFATRKRRNRIV